MRIAVIGGTAFIGRHFVEQALARGHELTVLHRGVTNPGLFAGATELLGDRNRPDDLARLADGSFDVVVDTCAYVPRQVRAAADTIGGSGAAYLLVSSVSVYRPSDAATTDEEHPRFTAEDLADPTTEAIDDQTYGPLKTMCEDLAMAAFERCTVVRPTYVVGPHDRSDRFTSWVRRIATGGPVLAAEPADGPIQVIDVRDLAAFMLHLVERGTTGVFNGAGPAEPITWRELFEAVAAQVGGPDHRMVWVDPDWLGARGVDVPVQMPMWASQAEASMLRADVRRSVAAGLQLRPLSSTIEDLWHWDRDRGLPPLAAGLDDVTYRSLLDQSM